jgi:UPF0755 protein
MKKVRNLLIFVVAPFVAITLLVTMRILLLPLPITSTTIVTVGENDSYAKIEKSLIENRVIRHPKILRVVAQIRGLDRRIYAGQYVVRPEMTTIDVFRILSSGVIVPDDISITIPEGSSITEISRILNAELGIKEVDFISNTRNSDHYSGYWFLSSLDEGDSLEGYLFPDTYRISKGSGAASVILAMLSGMENVLSELGVSPSNGIAAPIETTHELLTLASIIQKESPKGEMAVISGVFTNRLNDGWRLESDATVNYVLGTKMLTPSFEDVHVSSPYNTYLNTGLPPGPITNPGREAISAAISPLQTEAYFFLHTPEGITILSRTYEEHLYQRSLYWE